MEMGLAGKRIVITGASSGLGEHFAHVMSNEGASLGLLARRKEKLQSIADELEPANAGAIAVAECDVLDSGSVESALKEVRANLGGIDVLVNNAGVTRQAPALEQSPEDWDAVVNTNLRGAWYAATATAKLMTSDGITGSIINIASILGERVASHVAPYAVSKAGLVHMTKALALEWARHGIRVNALEPGYLRTDMNKDFFDSDAGKALVSRIPQRRLGELSELNGPLLLLASDASSFMTGAIIPVDGGHLVNTL